LSTALRRRSEGNARMQKTTAIKMIFGIIAVFATLNTLAVKPTVS